MKLIFLNTWKGQAGEHFVDFVRAHAPHADMLLLQEASDEVVRVCREAVPTYQMQSARRKLGDGEIQQTTFSAPHARILSSEVLFHDRTDVGLGLYVEVEVGDATLHVFNFHGAAQPGDKLDCPERVFASKRIIEFMSTKKGPKVIGGDFNLLPETESVRMFEEAGYTNLIKAHNIPTTRNRLSLDLYEVKQYFADYVFTSSEIRILSFEVPYNEASDHLPLILEIEVMQ
jgi:endonuclease/exonuclease/phosphatase family metal-dependent hydrolase